MQRLHSTSTALIQQHGSENLYEGLLDAAVEIMRSDYASLQMLHPERGRGGELRLLAFRGFSSEAASFWEWVRADSYSTCGAALRQKTRVIASDVQHCDFMQGTEDLATYLETGIRAVQTTPLLSREGTVVGMISTHWREPHQPAEGDLRLFDLLARQAADLIERNRTEEALRRAVEFDDAVIKHMAEGLYTVDQDGCVTFMNPSAERLFGWSSSEIVGRKMHDVTHHHHRDGTPYPAEDCAGLQVLRQGKTLTDHADVFIRKDGSFFDVVYSSAPLRSGNRVIGLVVVFRDMTEHQQAQDTLRRAERLAAAGEVAANVAHEINNPLQSLVNLINLISYKVPADDGVRQLTTMAQKELGRVARITRQMLAFSRDTVTPVPVRITEVLEDVIDLWTLKFREHRVKFERQYEEVNEVRGFPGELRQLFSNVIGNAVEASPAGGYVRVHVYPSRDWKSMRKGIRVVIVDRGPGIAHEHRKKVFDSFYSTKAERGRGLGLWVVKGLVERHKGSLHLTSTDRPQRSGTAVTVFLPYPSDGTPTFFADQS